MKVTVAGTGSVNVEAAQRKQDGGGRESRYAQLCCRNSLGRRAERGHCSRRAQGVKEMHFRCEILAACLFANGNQRSSRGGGGDPTWAKKNVH